MTGSRPAAIEPSRHAATTRWGDRLALGLLFAVVAVIQFFWTRADHAPMAVGDSYHYLGNLLRFLDDFGAPAADAFWLRLDQLSHIGRPPLYQILTLPSILLLGRSEDAALTVNLPFLAILLFSVYNIARLIEGRRAGLLAAFLIATYPPIVHLSRTYLPHFAAVSFTALCLWLMLRLVQTRSIRDALLFGIALALGLLTHPYFGLAMCLPSIGIGLYLLFQTSPADPVDSQQTRSWLLTRLRDRFVVRGLLAAAAIVVALAAPWYLIWGGKGVRLFGELSQANRCRPFGFPEVDCSMLWYLQTAPGALSNILAVLAALGLVAALLRKQRFGRLLALALVSTYLSLNLAIGNGWLIGAHLLPAAAALTATWITAAHPKWLSGALAFAAVVIGAFNFSVVTWGVTPWARPIAATLGSPLDDVKTCRGRFATALCPAQPGRDWHRDNILRPLIDDPACQAEQPCRLTVVESFWEQRITPALLFDLIAQRADERIDVKSIGLHSRVRHSDEELLTRLSADYVFYPEAAATQRSGHRDAGKAIKLLRSPPHAFVDSYRTVAAFDLPLNLPVWGSENVSSPLIRRTRPLTGFELESAAHALRISLTKSPEVHVAAARLYLSENNLERAFAIYAGLTESEARATLRRQLIAAYATEGSRHRLITLYQDHLALRPDDLAARIQLAAAYREAGDNDTAIIELKQVLDTQPDNIQAGRTLAHVYRILGRFEPASELYARLVNLDPGDPKYPIFLGEAYGRIGKHDEAVTLLETAMWRQPTSPLPRRFLADIYRSSGRKEESTRLYAEALALAPDEHMTRVRLMQGYASLGKIDAAMAELDRLMAAVPEHPYLQKVLEKNLRLLSRRDAAFEVYRQRLQP